MTAILRDIARRNRAGEAVSIPSVCSAHPAVLRASLLLAERLDRPIVIEATSNQVNQFRGYTGQTPRDFADWVWSAADELGVARERIALGGDHLGPQAWRAEPADIAMEKAAEMVRAYVAAGFGKIHLDCSEPCGGDQPVMTDELAAARAASLAAACLEAAGPDADGLCFVIGTEVPPPGGAHSDDDVVHPTPPGRAIATYAAHAEAFARAGLAEAWPLVSGLVVQPGVEFSPMAVHHLPDDAAPGLRAALEQMPGVTYEAHSTDYQHADAYPRLAALGFGFQKVGPALTFAYRRALYALDALAATLLGRPLRLAPVMERLMRADDRYWRGHYAPGDQLSAALHFGLADRIRYYWPHPEAQAATQAVMDDIAALAPPDPALLQAFSPEVLALAGDIDRPLPEAIVFAEISTSLSPYFFETKPC